MIRCVMVGILWGSFLLMGASARSQSAQQNQASFDVISVRPSASRDAPFAMRPRADDFLANGTTLKFLIQYAYNLHEFQVLDGEHWTGEEKFDVLAKMDDAGSRQYSSREEEDRILQARLRVLLKDRFHLKVDQATAMMPVLAMQVAGRTRLSAPKSDGNFTMGWGLLTCSDVSMGDFADLLSTQLRRPVEDQTGLSGSYSLELKWNPDETSTSSTLPMIETAVREQLGLKLSAARGMLKVVHILAAERPAEN